MADEHVSLVIPGRNCASTIGACLDAVVPMLEATTLREIIFVDDGSTDDTPTIVAEYPVKRIAGSGRGPGSARNLGWQAANHSLVWFVDSDCVAEPDALTLLLPHLADEPVAAVSGSYGNMAADSLLACLIHEEIVTRHQAMPSRVDFLATFNVLYRRSVLEQTGGFDERYLKGQDAELSWRVLEAGYELGFEVRSRVKHYHPVAWGPYLRTQRQQGYWRVFLHLSHRGHARGDTYSSVIDHAQPPLAMLALVSLPLMFFWPVQWVPGVVVGLLALAQVPMTWRLVRRKREWRYLAYAWMSLVRAFWRGAGMVAALPAALRRGDRGESPLAADVTGRNSAPSDQSRDAG